MIEFLLNNKLVSIENEAADLTLLNFLRNNCDLTGTKEGCASGDCGACTVVVAEPVDNAQSQERPLQYKAINSCITFLSALHGKQVITVEALSKGEQLHPVQQAMVDENATQCGFCTPGFVMSIYALYQQNKQVNKEQVIHALSGNLCRCTGYKSIISSALTACNKAKNTTDAQEETESARRLKEIQSKPKSGTNTLHLPKSRQALAACIAKYPNASLVAGSTDLALLHTQQLQELPCLISVAYVPELAAISVNDSILSIGAACTLSDLQPALLTHFPSLQEIMTRFASLPIRNQATIGGNIANASPIADLAPVLIALNAQLVLDNGAHYREIALKDFFTAYRSTLLADGEWLSRIDIPLLNDGQHLAAYKISKRFEDDISAVCMAINISLHKGKVTALSTGFGGVAATPAYCDVLAQALIGKEWQSEECLSLGKAILSQAFSPLDDVRASAQYRIQMLENLWHRFWLETSTEYVQNSIAIRVQHHA